jgi:hypothetical protein
MQVAGRVIDGPRRRPSPSRGISANRTRVAVALIVPPEPAVGPTVLSSRLRNPYGVAVPNAQAHQRGDSSRVEAQDRGLGQCSGMTPEKQG